MSNNLASNNEFSFPYEDSSDITLESITRYLADLTGYSITSDITGIVDLLHDLDSEQKKNERLSIQIVQTLASALDARDSYTRGHSSRVALYSLEIARRYGYSEKNTDRNLYDGTFTSMLFSTIRIVHLCLKAVSSVKTFWSDVFMVANTKRFPGILILVLASPYT